MDTDTEQPPYEPGPDDRSPSKHLLPVIELRGGEPVVLHPHLARIFGVSQEEIGGAILSLGPRLLEDMFYVLDERELAQLRRGSLIPDASGGPDAFGHEWPMVPCVFAFTIEGVIALSFHLESTTAMAFSAGVMRSFAQLHRDVLFEPTIGCRLDFAEFTFTALDAAVDPAVAGLFEALRNMAGPRPLLWTEETGPLRLLWNEVDEPYAAEHE